MDPGAPGTVGFAVLKGSAIVFCIVALAYPFYRVLSMWIDRALDASEAVLYLGTLTLLLLGVIVTLGTPVGWLLLAALLASCLGLPLLNRVGERLALRRMEDSDIREFSATLQRQPRNTYLRERLARILLSRRQYELALAQVELALEATPKDRNLELLRDRVRTEHRRVVERLKICPKCAAENHAEAGCCASCAFLFVDPADLVRVFWTRPALDAARWGGLGMLLLGLVLMLLSANLVVVTGLLFLAIVSLFWYGYVHLSRL
jgi:hypothetical protein